ASCMSLTHASTLGWPARVGRPSSASRSISELPMPSGRSHARDPPAAAPRSDGDRGDRAQRLSNAVVALDVRRRALEAVFGLPRRLRGADSAWLPDHFA